MIEPTCMRYVKCELTLNDNKNNQIKERGYLFVFFFPFVCLFYLQMYLIEHGGKIEHFTPTLLVRVLYS